MQTGYEEKLFPHEEGAAVEEVTQGGVQSPFLRGFKARLDEALSILVWPRR